MRIPFCEHHGNLLFDHFAHCPARFISSFQCILFSAAIVILFSLAIVPFVYCTFFLAVPYYLYCDKPVLSKAIVAYVLMAIVT